MSLKEKILGTVAGIGIGLAVLCGGCDSPEGNIALSALGNMTQASPYTSPNDKIIGVGASTIGQMGYQMNTAKAGKTEVNVYGGGNEQETIIHTAGGGIMAVDKSGRGIGWRVIPKDRCSITSPDGDEVTIGGLDYKSYVNAHPEKYKDGYKVEITENNKRQCIVRHKNWKGD